MSCWISLSLNRQTGSCILRSNDVTVRESRLDRGWIRYLRISLLICNALQRQRFSATTESFLVLEINDQKYLTPRVIMSDQKSHQGVTAPGYTEAEQNIDNTTEDISHKAQGHKANLSNPSKTLVSGVSSARTRLIISRHK